MGGRRTPPARGLAGCGPCGARGGGGAGGGCCCGVRSVALKVFPVETVDAFFVRLAGGYVVVDLDYVFDNGFDSVVSYPHTPAFVRDGVVAAYVTCVAFGLQSVAAKSAEGGSGVA